MKRALPWKDCAADLSAALPTYRQWLRLVSGHFYGFTDNALEGARLISFKTQRYFSHRRWHRDCTRNSEGFTARPGRKSRSRVREIIGQSMKTNQTKKTTVRVAVIDCDPLRFLGFCALLSSESDFELQSVPLNEMATHRDVHVGLLGSPAGRNVLEALTTLKGLCPGLDVIVTGCNMDDAAIVKVIAAGAKGCIDETVSVTEFVQAIRIVLAGSVWAPRRVLATLVEQAYISSQHGRSVGRRQFTIRETEVLAMLVSGCSNKEIAAPLGIEERTVKAHVAKLMRKVGVLNRVMLCVQVITHSLVASRDN
jgi:DNA-binding NarL/FixJ family response regulator